MAKKVDEIVVEAGHAERAHAKLSASGSKRWLTCTPSAQLELQFPDSTSTFAEEGTWAHEYAELLLTEILFNMDIKLFTRRLDNLMSTTFASAENYEAVESYVAFVKGRIEQARKSDPSSLVMLEQRVDFSEWVPEGFGTGDVVIVSNGTLEIIDLKFGKGVQVDAFGNTQLSLYALGAWNEFNMIYDVERVRVTIVQPRLNHISTDEFSLAQLLAWAEETVKPKARMAMNGEGEFVPGDHCRFCKARFTCRARAKEAIEADFKEPALLDDSEIAELLLKVDEIEKWAKDIQEYARSKAEQGTKFNGWKLVEGRSVRKYANPDQVAFRLFAEGYGEQDIYERELKSITAMEKALGKKRFNELCADLITKPPGKPALVPESDKRPEWNSLEQAKADFQ
jgi:hypothetical protein